MFVPLLRRTKRHGEHAGGGRQCRIADGFDSRGLVPWRRRRLRSLDAHGCCRCGMSLAQVPASEPASEVRSGITAWCPTRRVAGARGVRHHRTATIDERLGSMGLDPWNAISIDGGTVGWRRSQYRRRPVHHPCHRESPNPSGIVINGPSLSLGARGGAPSLCLAAQIDTTRSASAISRAT